ncbi:hypothetical protein [Nostoc sp. CCY 9925]|uniref:hypothetical protein n=1 Tax=Nostoc sp. CCY 9925 TaxID=3103865 RepID=UPI0039C7548F
MYLKYLKVLDHAYNSAYVFDSIIKQAEDLNDKYNGNFPLPYSESYIQNIKSSNIPARIVSTARPFQAPSSEKEVRGKNLGKFFEALKNQ